MAQALILKDEALIATPDPITDQCEVDGVPSSTANAPPGPSATDGGPTKGFDRSRHASESRITASIRPSVLNNNSGYSSDANGATNVCGTTADANIYNAN